MVLVLISENDVLPSEKRSANIQLSSEQTELTEIKFMLN